MRVIEAEELSKSFNGKQVLDRISFAVDEGEVFGFLGPNGAGKITTLRLLLGLLGFSQLLLGLKENQIIGFLVFFGGVFGITFTREALDPDFAATWFSLALIPGGVLMLLILTWNMTRFLSRERIVTTLP